MQELEISGLDRIVDKFDSLPKALRAARADIFEEAGEELLSGVRERIGGRGNIQGVQEYRVGSGKGYVVIRAKAKTFLKRGTGKEYAAGYITNAIENGHAIANPHTGQRLSGRVEGKHMYLATEASEAAQKVRDAVDELNRTIEKHMEGV